jgi:hypothetical protein
MSVVRIAKRFVVRNPRPQLNNDLVQLTVMVVSAECMFSLDVGARGSRQGARLILVNASAQQQSRLPGSSLSSS